MRKLTALGSLAWLIAAAGCSADAGDESVGQVSAKTIYGQDDREEPHTYSDAAWAARVLEFTVALISPNNIDLSDPEDVQISGPTLTEKGVCADERFASQIATASCSGTLIDEDIVVTAGHCINNCADSRFVFNYAEAPGGGLRRITESDVYSCVDFIASYQDNQGVDFAVVRLDRPVVGREPAAVRVSSAPLAQGTPLTAHGFPTGVPLKIVDDAEVLGTRADRAYFFANTDTFRGNSGSGVFDANTRELVGILADGPGDYFEDGECLRPTVCPQGGCAGQTPPHEEVTYAFHAIKPLCERTVSAVCSCGDEACGPLESPATCAADCSCGDGICSSGEDTSSCAADCQLDVLSAYHTQQPNWVTPGFQVRNTSSSSISLWRNTVRYYFTQEPPGSLVADCWGCSTNFEFSFHAMPGGGCAGATHYVDVRFLDTVTLAPAASTDQFRIAFRASSWLAFDPTNDYSFGGFGSTYTLNPKITMYDRLGERVFGDEPCPGVFVPPAD